MSQARAYFLAFGFSFVAACGGSVFNKSDDGGGASGNAGGSSSHAGTKGSAGRGGSTSSGGTHSNGGSVPTAGMATAGMVGIGGSMNCELVDCAYPVCDDGQQPVTPPGQCCPVCPAPLTGCQDVKCEPVEQCPGGYKLAQPPGACCLGCFPESGQVACLEIACPANNCPLGYVPGDVYGGCCYDCVPDPLFCNTAADCVIADRPRPCCGCPEAITRREYNADACWFEPAMPRMIPPECQPQVICDALCGACPPPGKALCEGNRCIQMGLK